MGTTDIIVFEIIRIRKLSRKQLRQTRCSAKGERVNMKSSPLVCDVEVRRWDGLNVGKTIIVVNERYIVINTTS
jgi:hypothetical protein